MSFGAGIALHQIEALDGNVKLGFFGIIKQHELAAGRRWCRESTRYHRIGRSQIERDQTAKPPDAVIDVHDEVADFQIAKVGKERRGARTFSLYFRFLFLNRKSA